MKEEVSKLSVIKAGIWIQQTADLPSNLTYQNPENKYTMG